MNRRDILKLAPLAAMANAHGQQLAQGVGSLYPLIESEVPKRLPLSFLDPQWKDYRQWKPAARAKLLDLLHYSPAKIAPRAELIERVDAGTHWREKVYFNTTPAIRVPAYVLVPKSLKKPAPAIVALHDHGGFYFWGKEKIVAMPGEHRVLTDFKQRYYGGKSIADEMASRGYVVIAIDMFYWGERRMLLDDDSAEWRTRPASIAKESVAAFNSRASFNEQLMGRTIASAGFTWSGVMFMDDVRTVDYLVTRPEVDAKRIACVGLSVGGLRSCHLAALDDRIKAAVIVGWMTSFPDQLRAHVRNTIGQTMIVPGLYKQMDYPDVATLAMPAAMLAINGNQDALFHPEGVRKAFDKLAACYAKAGIGGRVRTRLYDAPHEFNLEMQAEAWEWLAKWV